MLSPSIWADPAFNRLSVASRLLFIGLISNADDYGYVRADKGSVRRTIFGFDDDLSMVETALGEVKALRSVHFYEENGEEYIHLAKWHDYQKQQKDRMLASEYPPCSICVASGKQVRKEVEEVSSRSKKEESEHLIKLREEFGKKS